MKYAIVDLLWAKSHGIEILPEMRTSIDHGILLNADANGSYNIMRKVKGDAVMPPYTGFGYNPVKKFIN